VVHYFEAAFDEKKGLRDASKFKEREFYRVQQSTSKLIVTDV